MLNNQLISYIRTGVPLLVGLVLTWLAEHFGLVISDSSKVSLAALAVTVISGLYYAGARALENKWPRLGVLLGVPAKPNYPDKAALPGGDKGLTELIVVIIVVLILLGIVGAIVATKWLLVLIALALVIGLASRRR